MSQKLYALLAGLDLGIIISILAFVCFRELGMVC